VLLNEEVIDEEVIIPTLVLAKKAGGSLGYDDLAKNRKPKTGLGIVNLLYKAEAEDYAGWELADVVEGVPFMRILPMTANPRTYSGTQILRRVRIQVLSKKTKPPPYARATNLLQHEPCFRIMSLFTPLPRRGIFSETKVEVR